MSKEQTLGFEGRSYVGTNVQLKYKDTMFRMLFKEKDYREQLYKEYNL